MKSIFIIPKSWVKWIERTGHQYPNHERYIWISACSHVQGIIFLPYLNYKDTDLLLSVDSFEHLFVLVDKALV